MTPASLHQLQMSTQELIAYQHILKLSFDAFRRLHYPIYFKNFIDSLAQVVELGCMAATAARAQTDGSAFAEWLDQLSHWMQEARWVRPYKKEEN